MCFSCYLLSFLRLINEAKQNIDNLPGEDGTRFISKLSYNRINTVSNFDFDLAAAFFLRQKNIYYNRL